jgi:hypothetical protein
MPIRDVGDGPGSFCSAECAAATPQVQIAVLDSARVLLADHDFGFRSSASGRITGPIRQWRLLGRSGVGTPNHGGERLASQRSWQHAC